MHAVPLQVDIFHQTSVADVMPTQFLVPLNTNATLRCNAEPAPDLIQILALRPGEPNGTAVVVAEASSEDQTPQLLHYLIAQFSPASLDESGTVYECVAANDLGRDTDNITLVVQGQYGGWGLLSQNSCLLILD